MAIVVGLKYDEKGKAIRENKEEETKEIKEIKNKLSEKNK